MHLNYLTHQTYRTI